MVESPRPVSEDQLPALFKTAGNILSHLAINELLSVEERAVFSEKIFGPIITHLPATRNSAFGVIRRLAEIKAASTPMPEELRFRLESWTKKLPEFEARAVTVPDLDLLSTRCLLHDTNNLIAGSMIRADSPEIGTLISAVMRLSGRIIEYKALASHLEELADTLNRFSVETALALDAYISLAPADRLFPEALEARSIIHDLTGLPPVIEKVDLVSLVKSFISPERMFRDKNTQALVVPEIYIEDEEKSIHVLLDRGILFRTLRNLLNDVAAHGERQKSIIPAKISIRREGRNVTLSVANPGKLPTDQLQLIGRQVYSTSGGKEHGYGKVSISQMFGKLFQVIGINPKDIIPVLDNQWKNIKRTSFKSGYVGEAVRWQMELQSC